MIWKKKHLKQQNSESRVLNCETPLQVSNILTFTYLRMNYVFRILSHLKEIKHNLLQFINLISRKL